MKYLKDNQLINLCLDKSPQAWSEFVERFSKVIYWAIKDKLKRSGYSFKEQDVEDIYQEIFTKIWQGSKLKEIKNSEKTSGWLVMVAGNAAIDYFRRKNKKVSKHYNYSEQNELELDEELTLSNDNPLQVLYTQEIKEILESALESLTSRERITITLSHLHGKKHREIAELLNMPLNTVSTIISRTKQRLRGKLKERGIGAVEDI